MKWTRFVVPVVSAGLAVFLVAIALGDSKCVPGSSAETLSETLAYVNVAVAAVGLLVALRFAATGRGGTLWLASFALNIALLVAGVIHFGAACSA
jgi:hypothetical protein